MIENVVNIMNRTKLIIIPFAIIGILTTVIYSITFYPLKMSTAFIVNANSTIISIYSYFLEGFAVLIAVKCIFVYFNSFRLPESLFWEKILIRVCVVAAIAFIVNYAIFETQELRLNNGLVQVYNHGWQSVSTNEAQRLFCGVVRRDCAGTTAIVSFEALFFLVYGKRKISQNDMSFRGSANSKTPAAN